MSARPAPGLEARPDEDGPGGAETWLVVVGFGGVAVVLDNELFVDLFLTRAMSPNADV